MKVKKKKKNKCKAHKRKYPCAFCVLLEEIARRRREGEIV